MFYETSVEVSAILIDCPTQKSRQTLDKNSIATFTDI